MLLILGILSIPRTAAITHEAEASTTPTELATPQDDGMIRPAGLANEPKPIQKPLPVKVKTVVSSIVTHIPKPKEQWPVPSGEDARAILLHWMQYYGINQATSLRIIACESGFDSTAYNELYGAAGYWQFLPGTWKNAANAIGHPEWTYEEYAFNAEVNAQLGAFLASRDGFGHWVCW